MRCDSFSMEPLDLRFHMGSARTGPSVRFETAAAQRREQHDTALLRKHCVYTTTSRPSLWA